MPSGRSPLARDLSRFIALGRGALVGSAAYRPAGNPHEIAVLRPVKALGVRVVALEPGGEAKRTNERQVAAIWPMDLVRPWSRVGRRQLK